jgi:hypothetical protein
MHCACEEDINGCSHITCKPHITQISYNFQEVIHNNRCPVQLFQIIWTNLQAIYNNSANWVSNLNQTYRLCASPPILWSWTMIPWNIFNFLILLYIHIKKFYFYLSPFSAQNWPVYHTVTSFFFLNFIRQLSQILCIVKRSTSTFQNNFNMISVLTHLAEWRTISTVTAI